MNKDKKVFKVVFTFFFIFIVMWVTMVGIDYWRTIHSLKKPVFARWTKMIKDVGSGTYTGIGYSVEIEGNFMPEDELPGVTNAQFFIFGNKIKQVIRDKRDEISEDRKRIDLYVTVMKSAYEEENGGNRFVTVKLETLEGLSEKAKMEVLKELTSLSPNVYSFDDVKNDSSMFERDKKGRLVRTLNGSLLWVDVKEYGNNKAIITGVSWFGNLGAVFPEYEATFQNGMWHLKLIKMAIS